MKYYLLLALLLCSCAPKPIYDVYFCPTDNCSEALVGMIQQSEDVKCAFYDLEVPEVISALEEKNAMLVLDARNPQMQNAVYGRDNHQMHNKFCIFNTSIVATGSYNPTHRGSTANNNNLVIIRSKDVAGYYLNEFEELRKGENRKSLRLAKPKIYFCPEDCSPGIYTRLISSAQDSVVYAAFSFTHPDIADALVAASRRGVDIHGVSESSQDSRYSVRQRLVDAGIDAQKDTNPAFMHHKFFVIDRRIVITGSANPTKNGMERNDENIIVVDDAALARRYMQEFDSMTP